MDIDQFLHLGAMSIETALMISAPVLMLGLIAGFVVSVFQAATQINDAALAFIPKIVAAAIALIFFGNFMINRLAHFTTWVFERIPTLSP